MACLAGRTESRDFLHNPFLILEIDMRQPLVSERFQMQLYALKQGNIFCKWPAVQGGRLGSPSQQCIVGTKATRMVITPACQACHFGNYTDEMLIY